MRKQKDLMDYKLQYLESKRHQLELVLSRFFFKNKLSVRKAKIMIFLPVIDLLLPIITKVLVSFVSDSC